jgi:lysophospholipase L1-like esterase
MPKPLILMIQKFFIAVLTMFMLTDQSTSAQKLLGIGSSTIAGDGALPREDSSWLNLLMHYYTQAGLPVSLKNLGYSGSTSFGGMPTSYATPVYPPQPGHPILGWNITAGLSFGPDYVIIAYPSNDLASGVPIARYLSNLRTIYDSITISGKTAFVATTQPRNDITDATKVLQREAKDSIIAEFPGHSLDFWTPLADPVTLRFKTGLTVDDIHPNNAGHLLLYQVAKNANIISLLPLAIKLTELSAVYHDQAVLLRWKSSDQTGPAAFWVQRSADELSFDDRWQEAGSGSSFPTDHSWTDEHPLAGKSFYRIKLIGQGTTSYSKVVSITSPSADWKIGKLYSGNGSLWNVEVLSGKTGRVALSVADASGKTVLRSVLSVSPPSTLIPLNLSGLANGLYFLQLYAPDGSHSTKAIQKK